METLEVGMPLIDFSKFDLLQLKQLHRELADEIDHRVQAERERVAEEIRRLANSVGMTVEELMVSRKGKQARKSKEQEKPVQPNR